MKKIVFVVLVCLSQQGFSQSIIFFDEGYNSDKGLDVTPNLRGKQACSSILTRFANRDSVNPTFEQGSLCKSIFAVLSGTSDSATFKNSITYRNVRSDNVFSNVTETVIVAKNNFPEGQRGEHGNWVSNAAFDFDKTQIHRPWQVFGIDRINSVDRWVTADRFPDNLVGNEVAGHTIERALEFLAFISEGLGTASENQLLNLGAVNMSLGLPAGPTSDARCAGNDGQLAVSKLRSRGVAVVVALMNNDVASNKKTWPACLSGVIKVVGEQASSFRSSPGDQAGVLQKILRQPRDEVIVMLHRG